MSINNFKFSRKKTLGIEPKNEEKVFIKIPLETGGFWEREYFQDDIIGNVINDFKAENHVDIPKDYFMDWNCKNKTLKMTDKIRTLLVHEIPTICFNPEMKKKPLIIQEKDIIPQVIGKPFNNPFEIFLFKKLDKTLKIQTYDEKIINKLGLNNYSSSSAYCNGNNQLFISGGETKKNEIINKLWQIDLGDNNLLYDPYIISPKKNHSMIFIPPEYVFVVGGNDRKTFFFESEKKEIGEWADLNKERIEPALQRIGNVLYCFDNVNKFNNEPLTFEKTDLNGKNPEWNLLSPKMDISLTNQKLPQKFFGVAKDNDNDIIFLGGNMDNYTDGNKLINYKYNPNINMIETSNVPYHDFNFKEKTFLPYNKNIDYILPDFNKQHPEVVFYVKNKSKVEKISYKPYPSIYSHDTLRGAKRPLFDSKYDFNMPIITIPDPLPETNVDNLNINNTQLKSEHPNNIKPSNLNDIREPSFQEYDINLNYKVKQIPPFKEPEIEANNGDQRLSIKIPNNLIKKPKEDEKKDIFVDLKLIEERNDNIEIDDEKEKLRNIPRPPKTQRQREIYTKIPSYNNEYTIPRFHYSVNDPGNELNITSKGKIYTCYIPKEPSRIKSNHADLNIKTSRIKKEDLILPNYNYSVNLMDKEYNDISPGNLGMSSGDIKLKGHINGKINNPKMNLSKSTNINFNSPDYKLSGNIPGINGTKIKLNSPNVPDYRLSGQIPGININGPKINLEAPDINGPKVDLKGPDYNINGNLPGIDINSPKFDIPSRNIKLKGPKIKGPDYSIEGNIPGYKFKRSSSTIDLKGSRYIPNYGIKTELPDGKLKASRLHFHSPQINIKGLRRLPNYSINGNTNINGYIPGINLKGPKINNSDFNLTGKIGDFKGNSPKINLPSGNINIEGPKINGPSYDLKGELPGMKVNIPKVDIKSPNLDLKGAEYDLSGNIPGMKINSPNINLKGSKIVGPDFNLKGDIPGMKINMPKVDIKSPDLNGPNYNLKGSIPGINVDGPEINMPSGKVNLRGPNIQSDYKLSGNIPGINTKNPNYILSGEIPSFRNKTPNLEIKNYKMTQPNIKVSTIDPNINIKNSYNNPSIKYSRNYSPGKRNFHASMNDPNYSEYNEFKGPRKPLISSQFKGLDLSPKIDKTKLNVSGNKIIDEKDVILQAPFNIDSQFLLKQQNKPNRNSVNLVVNKLEIKPEANYNEIKLPDKNIDIRVPKIEINKEDIDIKKNINLNKDDININVENNNNISLGGLGNSTINNEKVENGNNINIKIPKIKIKGETDIKTEIPKVEIQQPKLNSKVNLKKKDLTDLRFIPIVEEDKKYEVNVNVNLKNKNNKINYNLQESDIDNEEKNSKAFSGSERGNSRKKGKGLPTVGLKSSNFKASKIDIAGKLDVDNIDVNNLKSANVGVNGVKLGERIIE